MRRGQSFLVAAAVAATACGGGDAATAADPKGGTLVVSIAGLPEGTSAQVSLAGPGAPRSLGASDTLRGLAPGRYIITAAEASNDSAFFGATTAEQTVDIVDRQTVSARVDYVLSSASMAIHISGVPDGATAELTLTGADSVPRKITSTSILRRLRPGTYRVTTAPAQSGLDVYLPGGFPQTVSLTPSPTPYELQVRYELASGRLAIVVHGLPNGTAAQIRVTWGGQPDLLVQGDTVLTGLMSRKYSIQPVPTVVAGKTYATVEPYTIIDVPASRTPAVVPVTFYPPIGRLTIRTTGLPRGTPATIQLDGTQFRELKVDQELTLTDVPVGSLHLYPQKVDSPTGLYELRAIEPWTGFNVRPDSAIEITVRYALVTGLIAINVRGLPSGVDADLSMAASGADEQRFTGSRLVRVGWGQAHIVAYNVQTRQEGFIATRFLQSVFVDTGTTPISLDVEYSSVGPVNLTVADVRVMQQSYRRDRTVPLVAGKEALITVFVHGDTTNAAKPTLRARIYHSGALVHTLNLPSPQYGLATSVALDDVIGLINARIPGNLVQPGLGVVVDIDHDNKYDEPNESDNVFPRSQTPLAFLAAPVRAVGVRLVPIIQSGNYLLGDVSNANASAFMSQVRRMLPLGNTAVGVRNTFAVSGPLLRDDVETWSAAASELQALYAVEGSGDYYYGVVKTGYSAGIVGIGVVNGRVALGWDQLPAGSVTMAHELGHNFGLLHSPCGTTSGLDPNFPYLGNIGFGGFDLVTGRAIGSSTPDFMGYCNDPWISDYAYKHIFNSVVIGQAMRPAIQRAEAGVLVWGRVQGNRPILEPAFDVVARPSLPMRSGPHVLELIGADGSTLASWRFAGDRLDHGRNGDEVFAFVVPQSVLRGRSLGGVRLRARGRMAELRSAAAITADQARVRRTGANTAQVTWSDPAVRGVLVRDARTGDVLSFARGGAANLVTGAGEVELVISDGVRSRQRRVVVR